jgi:hypothetical protein
MHHMLNITTMRGKSYAVNIRKLVQCGEPLCGEGVCGERPSHQKNTLALYSKVDITAPKSFITMVSILLKHTKTIQTLNSGFSAEFLLHLNK